MLVLRLIQALRRHMKGLLTLCYIVLAILVAYDALFVDKSHAHTSVEKIVAFWALFGFGGCAALVYFAKYIGHLGIMTDEDYYD